MKFLDLNGVSILWRRIKETFARKSETVSDISRDDTTFTVTKADGTTFEFTQKDTTYDVATTTASGLMSAADKAKLNGMESGAQENVIESVSVNGTEQSVTDKGIDITVPTALSDLTDDVGYLTEESDPTVPAWAKQPQKPAYTASEVGALPADTHIPTDVSELNNDAGYLTEHQDISGIEDAIAGLTTKLNALADSDDTTLDQLSEIVAYIKNNKSLIDGITTGKVSVDDIVDNLTSSAVNKPLSAKQGKALKDMIDGIVVPTKVSQLTNDVGYLTEHQDISGKANAADLSAVATSGNYNDLTNKPVIPSKTSDLTNDVGYLATETDPTVPAWAKASTKPTYTAAEVGALPDDTVIPSKVSQLTNDAGYLTQHQDISGKANTADLAVVATSGSYTDLTDKPTIPVVPTNVSAFNNDTGYLTQHQDISGKANTADLATVATSGSYNDLSNKPTIPSKTSDLINDSGFGTYTKPNGGIPSSDLADSYIEEPSTAGTNGQVLTSDGNGGQSWQSVQTAPEIFVGSTTPSGYTVYIDPEGMVENARGVSF